MITAKQLEALCRAYEPGVTVAMCDSNGDVWRFNGKRLENISLGQGAGRTGEHDTW